MPRTSQKSPAKAKPATKATSKPAAKAATKAKAKPAAKSAAKRKAAPKAKASASPAPKAKANARPKSKPGLSYRQAGVDIDAGNAFVDFISSKVGSTYSDRVVKIEDGFAGMFSLVNGKRFQRQYTNPVLCAGTDGVGTKLKLAFALNKHDTVGIDLVAMCVNDLLCLGAEPIFFLDYLGTGKLEKGVSQQVLLGIIEGCKQAGAALLGGETAELPGMYARGEYDLAGFAVGVVEDGKQITGEHCQAGDLIIGLPSSGPHSNGFSLIRAALTPGDDPKPLATKPKQLRGKTLGEALLTPTRIYVKTILSLLEASGKKRTVHGLAHITGGGLGENLERILPKNVRATIYVDRWERPAIFSMIQDAGNVAEAEMRRVFNLGMGYLIMTPPKHADFVLSHLTSLGEKPVVIGNLSEGKRAVELV